MKKLSLLPIIALTCICAILASSSSQKTTASTTTSSKSTASDTLLVLSYNVENFFDPDDDPDKNDEDFTPDGNYHWTLSQQKNKAARLAKVFLNAKPNTLPDVIGLCEMEGPAAVKQLVEYGNLQNQNLNYQYVAFPTPDRRGIATALLFNANEMELLTSEAFRVSLPDSNLFTRDVLYAKMRAIRTNKTFHFMVNHWPSKRGGKWSIWARNYVAEQLKAKIDSLLSDDPNAALVLMGDFNATADEDALINILGAKTNCADCPLQNLSPDAQKASASYKYCAGNSYKYKGVWNTIDHFIVSQGTCALGRPIFSIVELPFLLEPDNRNSGMMPYRTHRGRQFNDKYDGIGGFSDHLPVMLQIAM